MEHPLAKPIDLKNDSAQRVRAKLWRHRNQRILFPIPENCKAVVKEMGLDPSKYVMNGIFSTVFKVGPGPSTGYMFANREEKDWVVSLRDVVLEDKDGNRIPFLYKNRSKKHRLEFSIKHFAAALAVVLKKQ